jgi:excisionase family DNA binding protein
MTPTTPATDAPTAAPAAPAAPAPALSTEGDILNAREAAQLLNVSVASLYRALQRQGVPSFQIGGTRRFRRTALLAWTARQEALQTATMRKATRAAANHEATL